MKRFFILFSFLVALSIAAAGQTKNEAIEAYNKAIDLKATDPGAAIKAYEQAIKISSELGEEGEEIKELAEIELSPLYYEVALKLYRERKIAEAITGFETAVTISEKYNDKDIKSRSENVLHQLYFTRGNELFRANDDEGAIGLFDKALALNPNYARAFLGKALVYRKQEKTPEFAEAMDMAIETGLLSNDERTVSTAESTARDYFMVRAVRAKDRKAYSEAIELAQSSLKYDQNFAEAYFLITVVANIQKRWDDAIEAGNKGLELLNSADDNDKAKYYFELGNAYAGKGDNAMACQSFREASVGTYLESAKYQIEQVLKCN
jgi:tetratricopeptide (TPR) repeat protein